MNIVEPICKATKYRRFVCSSKSRDSHHLETRAADMISISYFMLVQFIRLDLWDQKISDVIDFLQHSHICTYFPWHKHISVNAIFAFLFLCPHLLHFFIIFALSPNFYFSSWLIVLFMRRLCISMQKKCWTSIHKTKRFIQLGL